MKTKQVYIYVQFAIVKMNTTFFPSDFNEEQVIKANKLFRDFKKLFNKYDLNQSNIEIMDIVILIKIQKSFQ